MDKSVCATDGSRIGLLWYTSLYESMSDASGNLTVRYQGNDFTCYTGTKVKNETATCLISTPTREQSIKLSVNTTHCHLQEKD